MDNEQFNVQLIYMLKAIKKRFYIFIFVCLVSISSAIIYGKNYVSSYYETTTTIIVGAATSNQVNAFNLQDERYINTYAELFKTDIVAQKTIEKLDLNISADTLKESTTANTQKDTQLIDIKLKWENAEEGKQILETLSSVFIEEVKKIYPTVNVMIMDKVKEPKEVAVVKQSTCVMVGVLVGILLSLLITYGLEFMNNTIKEDEDIEKYLNVNLLANVPMDKNMINSINMKTLGGLNYSLAESYRTLRTNIEFSNIDKKVKSLIVTSARPGEGKSTSSAMLAVYMALAGKKTILVDCDLRKSKVKNLFNISNSVGFTNVLLGNVPLSEAIQKSKIDNLYILTSGLKPPNAAEILCSEKAKELINILRSDFEYVIIDTSPVGLITDAQVLSQYVDGCLLIVSSGKSKIDEVVRSKKLIEQVKGRVLGAVLNKYPDKIFDKEYRQYYGEKFMKKKETIHRCD